MFHLFENHEERKLYGGCAFMELQYCKANDGTTDKRIVCADSISHWKDDSLYIFEDDIEKFMKNYSSVFINGLHNNMQQGEIDEYGINYYTPLQVLEVINDIESSKPIEYSKLLDWLKKAAEYNGIYILGI